MSWREIQIEMAELLAQDGAICQTCLSNPNKAADHLLSKINLLKMAPASVAKKFKHNTEIYLMPSLVLLKGGH